MMPLHGGGNREVVSDSVLHYFLYMEKVPTNFYFFFIIIIIFVLPLT